MSTLGSVASAHTPATTHFASHPKAKPPEATGDTAKATIPSTTAATAAKTAKAGQLDRLT